MEEAQPPIDSVEEHSEKTAGLLRTMRDQAEQTLESHRLKISEIETELSRRIHQIAEELARDSTDDELAAAAANLQREELEKAQGSLQEADAEIAELRSQLASLSSDFEAESAAQAKKLQLLTEEQEELSQERQSLSDELGQVLTDQLKSSEELGELAEQIETLQQDLDQTSQERDQLTQQQQQLHEEHEQLGQDRNQLVEDLERLLADRDQLADELEKLLADAEENDRQRDQLSSDMQELGTDRQSLQEERDQLAEQLEQLLTDAEQNDQHRDQVTGELKEVVAERETLQNECELSAENIAQLEADAEQKDQLREQLTKELEELHSRYAQLSGERDQMVEEQEQHRAEHEALATQLGGELQAARDALDEVQNEEGKESARLREELANVSEGSAQAQEQYTAIEAQLENLLQERDQALQAIEESRTSDRDLNEQLEQQRNEHQRLLDEQKEQLEQSEAKCDLALADVHKLKRANAELHEELASRPETDDQDSPELVSLRAERDALAGRVEELESARLPNLDEDGQQELSDLQSRFEMAVEDVRSLKQENASLREKLDASPTVSTEDSGDMGWQAQKARLLASLDDEAGETVTPERREERTTIEGTISITDQVVSVKDREIAELKQQLESRPVESESEFDIEAAKEEAVRAAHEELFSKDEVIQNERQRLAELQGEWEDKLRAAELEISVQRASLAREKANVEEKLAMLESQTAEQENKGGKPRHRWLSALGLDEDEADEEDS